MSSGLPVGASGGHLVASRDTQKDVWVRSGRLWGAGLASGEHGLGPKLQGPGQAHVLSTKRRKLAKDGSFQKDGSQQKTEVKKRRKLEKTEVRKRRKLKLDEKTKTKVKVRVKKTKTKTKTKVKLKVKVSSFVRAGTVYYLKSKLARPQTQNYM